ncbi:hypothetical protein HK100_002266, partial [Physocladia obscura]
MSKLNANTWIPGWPRKQSSTSSRVESPKEPPRSTELRETNPNLLSPLYKLDLSQVTSTDYLDSGFVSANGPNSNHELLFEALENVAKSGSVLTRSDIDLLHLRMSALEVDRLSKAKISFEEMVPYYRFAAEALEKAYSVFYKSAKDSPISTPITTNYDKWRDWQSEGWRLSNDIDQDVTLLNLTTGEMEVYTVARHGTSCPESYVSVSHVWGKELYGSTPQDWRRAAKLAWAIRAVDLTGKEYAQQGWNTYKYLWMDLVSVNQQHEGAIRAATYSMSYAYHCADVTVVVQPDWTGSAEGSPWFKRLWTLQESFLSYHLAFVHVNDHIEFCKKEEDNFSHDLDGGLWRKLRSGEFTAYDVVKAARHRDTHFKQDVVYAISNILKGCGGIRATYDAPLDRLYREMAEMLFNAQEYSLFRAAHSDVQCFPVMGPVNDKCSRHRLNIIQFDRRRGGLITLSKVVVCNENTQHSIHFNRKEKILPLLPETHGVLYLSQTTKVGDIDDGAGIVLLEVFPEKDAKTVAGRAAGEYSHGHLKNYWDWEDLKKAKGVGLCGCIVMK